MQKLLIYRHLGLVSLSLIAATTFSNFALIPQTASAATKTSNINRKSGPKGTIKYKSKKLATTCTLKTSNGKLAYYVDDKGTQYISSAKKGQVDSSATEISTNAAKSGRLRAKANLPKDLWKLVFDKPTLSGKSSANQRLLRVSNPGGGNTTGWQKKIKNYKPQVAANKYADLAVDVRFRNQYFKPGVYKASVVVTCMAT
jgi:hypothetical protein